MDSQCKLLSEWLSDQAAFLTSPKTSLANYWGALPPCPPVSTGLDSVLESLFSFSNVDHKRQPLYSIFSRPYVVVVFATGSCK